MISKRNNDRLNVNSLDSRILRMFNLIKMICRLHSHFSALSPSLSISLYAIFGYILDMDIGHIQKLHHQQFE